MTAKTDPTAAGAKLTSRNFLTALIGFVVGLAMAFGLDEGAIATVAGAAGAIQEAVDAIAEGCDDN